MEKHVENSILRLTGAARIEDVDLIQTLWKGYGEIIKVRLNGTSHPSVVVKHVALPQKQSRHGKPDPSHQRKVKSYRVETQFYQSLAGKCDTDCRVPACIGIATHGDEVIMVLEDLDEAGFPGRAPSAAWHEITAGLKWLAAFHATFLNIPPDGLWKVGTYWHLDTRPDELKRLNDPMLKSAARAIDQRLRNCPQTLVHGDAKIQNFCFSKDGSQIAAIDFQYIGSGCGMKDVAYFASSCLYESDCEEMESAILDIYFDALKDAINKKRPDIDSSEIEAEWRPLYRVAWTDFHRFYKGWGHGRFSPKSYSERVSKEVCDALHRRK